MAITLADAPSFSAAIMSKLATQAELHKLARALNVGVDQLQFMTHIAPDGLRHFRMAYTDIIFNQQRAAFRWVVWWARWLPIWLLATIARVAMGPALTARMAGELPAWRVAAIAHYLPADFVADVAVGFEARAARELVYLLSSAQIVAIAQVLLQRRDFMTMGRFVGLLPDAVIQEVAASISDDGDLLEIAFYIESRDRIDHLVQVLPAERVRRALLIIINPAQRQHWPKLLALVTNVGHHQRRELGELAASQGEAVLIAIIHAAQEDQLWEDILPVVTCLSPEVQRRVINLAAVQQPAVMNSIIQAADSAGLWCDILAIAAFMNDAGRDAVAQALLTISGPVLEHIAYAALIRAQWATVLDIVRRLPRLKHLECLQILERYVDQLDAETAALIGHELQRNGITRALTY